MEMANLAGLVKTRKERIRSRCCCPYALEIECQCGLLSVHFAVKLAVKGPACPSGLKYLLRDEGVVFDRGRNGREVNRIFLDAEIISHVTDVVSPSVLFDTLRGGYGSLSYMTCRRKSNREECQTATRS